MTRRDAAGLCQRAASLLYPRVCPFCGALLGQHAKDAAVCPACVAEEERLSHQPPRLPDGDHDFYALNDKMAAYYYADEVSTAILRCKRGGQWHFARELADRMAVRIWGADPAQKPGQRPQYTGVPGMALYGCLVPVPPREATGEPSLPALLAKRLGEILQIPVIDALQTTRPLRPQKELTRAERILNVRGVYACRPGADIADKRVLLVRDSFACAFTPYLAQACAELDTIDKRAFPQTIASYIEETKPDLVLFLYNAAEMPAAENFQ